MLSNFLQNARAPEQNESAKRAVFPPCKHSNNGRRQLDFGKNNLNVLNTKDTKAIRKFVDDV